MGGGLGTGRRSLRPSAVTERTVPWLERRRGSKCGALLDDRRPARTECEPEDYKSRHCEDPPGDGDGTSVIAEELGLPVEIARQRSVAVDYRCARVIP